MNSPEIKQIQSKTLVGHSISTSMVNDKTSLLWSRFMKMKAAVKNTRSKDLFSVQIYGDTFINGDFNGQTEFDKWAAVEVHTFNTTPAGFEELIIPAGKYAVFTHHGAAKDFSRTAEYIFGDWIPNSNYELDNRPHFEVLGEAYKGPDNAESIEKIYIPIKEK